MSLFKSSTTETLLKQKNANSRSRDLIINNLFRLATWRSRWRTSEKCLFLSDRSVIWQAHFLNKALFSPNNKRSSLLRQNEFIISLQFCDKTYFVVLI